MSKLNQNKTPSRSVHAHWAWLLPILALSPLALAAKGCDNAGVVGDDCPTTEACTSGNAGAGSGVPAGKACGGLLGVACADGLFCEYASNARCGAADQQGVCAAKPEACTDEYAPVCGCDGKTYATECVAHGAGVSVASSGECAPSGGGTGGSSSGGGTCGGIAALKCEAGQYCNFPPATKCGSGDQTGTCTDIPQVCDQIYAPVCGCDGKTYSSDCVAAGAGVSVAATGECKPTGSTCGGRGGGTCASDEYCSYAPDAQCGRADATGTCTKIPKDTGCITLYAPVCGCDGKTYGNDCEATVAGMSIDHTGACGATTDSCGGLLAKQCSSGYFCDFPPGAACGAADATGSCTKTPDVCPAIVQPVCGCDSKTYSNSCIANAKGVSVAYQGACK